MKLEDLFEDFYDAFLIKKGNASEYVELFVNPTSKELKELNSTEGVRGFLTNSDLILWNNLDVLHQEVREKLNLNNDVISLVLYTIPGEHDIDVLVTDNNKNSKWYHNPEIEEYITEHPAWWVDPDYINVYYHDEDVVGRWEELND